jgi:hypothetical protein
MVDEGGLARADLPRDDDEALTLDKAVLEIANGLFMLPAFEEKTVIGVELKRQPTKIGVRMPVKSMRVNMGRPRARMLDAIGVTPA